MQIDILDPYLYASDPHPTYSWLRENAPVYRDEKNDLLVLSRYAEVEFVSKHPKTYSSAQGVMPDTDTQISMVTMDDPRHTQLRSLVSRGFTPRMVGNFEKKIREVVTACIDTIASRGECEFVSELAVPLPLLVIAEMIGVRREDYDRFVEWSDTMILAAGQYSNTEVLGRASMAYIEYGAYLQDIFEEKRRNPTDDLVSILVAAQSDGRLASADKIELDELMMFMTLLLVAGNETTRNALSGGMLALCEHPEQRQKLIARPELLTAATEEILRWVSPINGFRRTVTHETELNGVELHPGDKVLMLYQSANRDAAVFTEPDRFKIDRTPNEHLAFGIGTHFCLGANLARLEIKIMFEELLRRLPDIRLAPGTAPYRKPAVLVSTIGKMPMAFTPVGVGSSAGDARVSG